MSFRFGNLVTAYWGRWTVSVLALEETVGPFFSILEYFERCQAVGSRKCFCRGFSFAFLAFCVSLESWWTSTLDLSLSLECGLLDNEIASS